MSSIQLNKITKRFNDFTAVSELSLDIAEGEFVALLGPSGCGKTTTMNMIAGLEGPSEGSILFNGQDLFVIAEVVLHESPSLLELYGAMLLATGALVATRRRPEGR